MSKAMWPLGREAMPSSSALLFPHRCRGGEKGGAPLAPSLLPSSPAPLHGSEGICGELEMWVREQGSTPRRGRRGQGGAGVFEPPTRVQCWSASLVQCLQHLGSLITTRHQVWELGPCTSQ